MSWGFKKTIESFFDEKNKHELSSQRNSGIPIKGLKFLIKHARMLFQISQVLNSWEFIITRIRFPNSDTRNLNLYHTLVIEFAFISYFLLDNANLKIFVLVV